MTYVALLRFLSFSPEAATVQWVISERDADEPVPCHVYLWNDQQKPIQLPGLPFWKNHFATHGEFEIDCLPAITPLNSSGPEYRRIQGSMEVRDEDDMMRQHHRLERLVDLAEEGWISGELHIHRPLGRCPCSFRRLICMLGLSFPGGTSEILGRAAKPEDLWKKSHPNGFFHGWGR